MFVLHVLHVSTANTSTLIPCIYNVQRDTYAVILDITCHDTRDRASILWFHCSMLGVKLYTTLVFYCNNWYPSLLQVDTCHTLLQEWRYFSISLLCRYAVGISMTFVLIFYSIVIINTAWRCIDCLQRSAYDLKWPSFSFQPK